MQARDSKNITGDNSSSENNPETKSSSPKSRRVHIKVSKRGTKTTILLKRNLYKKIKKHVLVSWRRKIRKLRRKRISALATSKERPVQANSMSQATPDKAIECTRKPFEEQELSHLISNPITSGVDLSNDLFVALPQVASNSGSLSPTEAFLMSFPVVSGVSAGKVTDPVDTHSLPVAHPTPTTSAAITDTAFAQKENHHSTGKGMANYPIQKYPPTPANEPTFSFSLTTMANHASHQHNLSATGSGNVHDMTTHGRLMPHPTSHLTNHHYNMAQVVPSESLLSLKVQSTALPGISESSSLSTDTKTTNSWSYNRAKLHLLEACGNVGEIQATTASQSHRMDYTDTTAQPFTFALTKSTVSDTQVATAIFDAPPQVSTGTTGSSMLFDGYNAGAFNVFPNAYMGSAAVLPTDCQYATNAFSFQLTSSSSSQPTYTPMPSHATTSNPHLNSFSMSATLQQSSSPTKRTTSKPNSVTDHSHLHGSSKPLEVNQRRDKTTTTTTHRKSSAGEKKKAVVAAAAAHVEVAPVVAVAPNKSHVNWMTDSTRNYTSTTTEHHHHYPAISQPCNAYASDPIQPHSTAGQGSTSVFREDFNQKSDIFFAHPGGEDRFLWNPPMMDTDRSVRPTDYNVPQLLPPTFVQADASIFSGQGAGEMKQSTTSSSHGKLGSTDYQPNGSYFSVSSLVGPNKKYSNTSHNNLNIHQSMSMESNGSKWKSPSCTNWLELDCNSKGHPPMHMSSVSKASVYSAEALIGSNQTYSASGSATSGTYKPSTKRKNVFSIQECINPVAGDIAESDGIDYTSYNLLNAVPSPAQFGTRMDGKMNQQPANAIQEPTNPFPYFSNEFMQPPLFPAPPNLPMLVPEHGSVGSSSSAINKSSHKQQTLSSAGRISGAGHKRKTRYEDSTGPHMILPGTGDPAAPMGGHQPNYDLTSSASYFSAPSQPHPPSFLFNPDSFNYSDNCKLAQPPFVASAAPPLDFNVTPLGPSSNYTANYLPNFNLSSICPEINNSIH